MWKPHYKEPRYNEPRYNESILTVPKHNLRRYNEYFVLSLAVGKNDMMIKMFDKPNTTPVGQDRETNFDLQSFALFRCSCLRTSL